MKRIYYDDLVFFASLHLFYRTEINFEDSKPPSVVPKHQKAGSNLGFPRVQLER